MSYQITSQEYLQTSSCTLLHVTGPPMWRRYKQCFVLPILLWINLREIEVSHKRRTGFSNLKLSNVLPLAGVVTRAELKEWKSASDYSINGWSETGKLTAIKYGNNSPFLSHTAKYFWCFCITCRRCTSQLPLLKVTKTKLAWNGLSYFD